MSIDYRTLENYSHEEMHKCLQECFADYQLDMSYLTLEAMIFRQKLGRVNLNYSVGAFDQEKMIALLIVAVDEFNGEKTAFDAGTGVVKKYRGKGIAGAMFKFSIARLKEENISQFMLEVLQENEPAIKAYKKEGFEIRREFDCYDLKKGNFQNGLNIISGIEIKKMSLNELEENWGSLKMEQSWEQAFNGIKLNFDSLIVDGAFQENQCVGFIVYVPQLCWLIAITAKNESVCKLLITHLNGKINPIRPFISWNNIEPGYKLAETMEKMGFELFVKQYEMIYKIG